MPRKYKKAAASRRRRRPRLKANTVSMPRRGLATIPDRLFIRANYSSSFVLSSTAVPVSHLFRTSYFDPDLTGVGHQPLGHDQYNAFYNKYRCYGIAYEITCVNESGATQADVSLLHRGDASTITNQDTLWEQSYSKHKILGVEGSGQAVKTFRGRLSAARCLGFTKLQFSTDDLTQAGFGSNPFHMGFLHCVSQAVDGSSSVSVRWRVKLTLSLEIFNRVTLTQS